MPALFTSMSRGQPEEVAAVARFLVSGGGSYVTGQRIYVHGGATITPEDH